MGSEASAIFASGLLDGRVVLVTGGGTNLGRAAAAELIRCGARVVIAGRREEVLAETAAALGPSCSWLVGDVREPESCRALVDGVVGRHGRLDVLVSSAGGQYFTAAEEISLRGWRAVMRLNVGGTLQMAEAAAAVMRHAGGGTIVNTTLSPHHGLVGMAHSSAARAAVEALTRELAEEWARDGITVCAVAPGHFDTTSLAKYPEAIRRGAADAVPLQRLGRMEEHAWLVALLASPLGPAFGGSIVTLDGARDNWFGRWPPAGMTEPDGSVPREQRRSRLVT